jgi:hypothetical protein
MHRRAQASHVDLLRLDPRKDELIAIRARNIKPQRRALPAAALGRAGEKPPIDQVARMTGGGKRIDKIRPDLIAAGADAGADCRREIGRIDSTLIS